MAEVVRGAVMGGKWVEFVKLGEKVGENCRAVFFYWRFFNFYRNN